MANISTSGQLPAVGIARYDFSLLMVVNNWLKVLLGY